MSPQPAAAPTPPADEKPVEKRLHDELLTQIEGTDPDERDTAEKQVMRALSLEQERGAIMKKIAANRTYLRLMEENEELTDEQADWLDDFYPQKEKGQTRSEDDIERTRKAKAAARAS